jgi:hypothetical protein
VLCEPGTAEHLLTRALARDVGGRALRLRHRLLLGWVALRSGRWSAAQAALEEARSQQLAPRERLLRDAIDAGLARRAGWRRPGGGPKACCCVTRLTCWRSTPWAS